jgi:hypothetical protein
MIKGAVLGGGWEGQASRCLEKVSTLSCGKGVDNSVSGALIPSSIKGFWKNAYFWVKKLVNKIVRLFPGRLERAVLVGFPRSRLIRPLIYQHSTGACFQ